MTSSKHTLPPIDQLALFEASAVRELAASGLGTRLVKGLPIGLRDHRDVFNARLLNGLTLVGPHDIPKIHPSALVPRKLVAFSEAISSTAADSDAWVHFYEDDYRFIRLWNDPEACFTLLEPFAGIISPDFSLYRNMPVAQKVDHTYKNHLLGARMQADGFNVIANVRLSGRSSIPYALAGAPRQSTIALGLHGCTRDLQNRPLVNEEVRIICDELSPSHIVIYGSPAYGVVDYPRQLGIPVHVFKPDTFHRSYWRKAIA
jgi:hypothetical protein